MNGNMYIEFQNSIERLSFLCRLTDIKITWINPSWFLRGYQVPPHKFLPFPKNFEHVPLKGYSLDWWCFLN